MALCHDERDFAMRFSRYNPHAHHTTVSEERGKQERKLYLDSLPPDQKEAYDRVQTCLQAVGQYFSAKGEIVPIRIPELHKYFPAFAERMGWEGHLYQATAGVCPAIAVSFPEREGHFWLFSPYDFYERMSGEEKEALRSAPLYQAALAFCKEWLPDWKWDRVTLPS